MCIADPIPFGYGSNTMINSNYHHGWYVNGRDIFTATESCFLEAIEAWVNNALSLVGIDGKAIGARALLSRLLIYPVGGYCKEQVQLCEEPGD